MQTFAHLQQFCHPGTKGNRFSHVEAVPRCEAACVVCAQKNYYEHRHKLSLFGAAPETEASEHCADVTRDRDDESEGLANVSDTQTLVQHHGVYYLESPDLVHQLSNVD